MKKHQFLALLPLISVLFLSSLFFPPAVSSLAAEQTIQNGTNNGAIRVTVYDSGQMGVWRCDLSKVPGGGDCRATGGENVEWITHVFKGNDDYWKHSLVSLDGGNQAMRFCSGVSSHFRMEQPWTPKSNINAGDNSITSVFFVANDNVRITQTTSIRPGDNYYKMRWDIENISQAVYNDLRFVHGEDTFLAGDDRGEGYFDNTQRMAYITNVAYGIADMMGIYADPTTPFIRYFEGKYSLNFTHMREWTQDNTVSPTNVDAGYSLGWARDSLAPGETWTIIAYEKFMWSHDILVIAPAEQTGGPGTTVSYPFIVQNLNATDENISLWVSGNAWPATIHDASGNEISSVYIPGGGWEQATVYVQVLIPLTAAAGDTDPVTLTGAAGSYSGSDTTTTTASAGSPGPESGDLAPHDGFRGNGTCGIIVGPDENETPGVATGAELTAIYFAILLAPVALLKWRSHAGKQGRANKPWPRNKTDSNQNGQEREEETKG